MSEYKNFDLGDAETFDALSKFYLIHVYSMTVENLHSKADVAWELSYRDNKIKQLEAERDALLDEVEGLETELEKELQENASLHLKLDYERKAE